MLSSSFWQTARKQLLSYKFLLWTLIIAFSYFSFSVLLLNYRFLISSFLGNYPTLYKLNVVYVLIQGSYSALSPQDFYLLIVTSVLVGANIIMVVKLIRELQESKGKLSFVVGGSTLVGVVVAGCSSCGFSILSILGLAGALSFIPFGGLGLHLIIIALLMFSILYSLRTYHYKIVCKIK